MPRQWHRFIPVTKVDEVQRLVYGVAALEIEDKSGEIYDYETSKPLFQKWSEGMAAASDGKNLGNVRAMHGKVAAGRLTQVNYDDAQKMVNVCAYISDDNEWNKVRDATYTGFSIGGDYVKTWKDEETGLRRYTASIAEVSIVDNPAMPGAHFTMVKADGHTEAKSFAKYATMENTAVVITNNMVVIRAKEMAKAATGSDDKYADHIAAAREELTKAAEMLDPAMQNLPATTVGQVKPSGEAAITQVGSTVENDHEVLDGEGFGEDGKMQNLPKGAKPPGAGPDAPTGTGGGNAATHPALPIGGKSATATNLDPRNEVKQGWQAKDGSFHISKAAAIAHNDTLSDPGNALEAAIAKASGALAAAKAADPNDSAVIDAEEKKKGKKGDKPWNKGDEEATTEATSKAAGASPYGDVKYADPGYKADKKKRYPVDTEAHIRAAWSYIHKPKNHTGYTASQVDKIKSNIVEAWKSVIGGEPPAANTKAFGANTLNKGLHHVSRLAGLVEELTWLQSACEMEEEWEKDTSSVPAQLKGDIASLVGTLKNMLDEETSELFDEEQLLMFASELEMAAGGVDKGRLAKYAEYIGDKPLNKSNGTIGTLHGLLLKASKMTQEDQDKIQAMHDHCTAMGAKCDGGTEKAAHGSSLNKADFDRLQGQNERLTGLVEKATTALGKMAQDLEDLKAQPQVQQPYKFNVAEKGGGFSGVDGGNPGSGPQSELLKMFTPDQLAVAALKLTHSAGGHVVNTRSMNGGR